MGKLFSIKGFLPYTVMLFLNAFVDLGHKIVIQNTVFKIYDGQMQVILTAIVNALILLPYIMLFSPSGYISDKYPKHKVMLYSALVEVFTVTLVIVAYYFGWFWWAFFLTLFMAIQSAIYSPAKYGYIRELVGDEHLAAGNGVVQAATIIAILGGTLVFSACFEWLLTGIPLLSPGQILQSIYPLGFLILLFALVEFALAFYLPAKRDVDATRSFSLNDYFRGRYLKTNIDAITSKSIIWLSIVGLLVFWAASQVVLASFPAFAKKVLLETNTLVIQGILASTGIGIMAGSLFAGRISRQSIELSLIPVGVIGFSLLIGVITLLHSAISMALTFILIGFFGGIYIVPLNALMQYHSQANDIGTVLAGNNWIQNIVMCVALGLTIILAYFGLDSIGLFYCLMLASLAFAVYIIVKLPHSMARFLHLAAHPFSKVEVRGFGHLPKHTGVLMAGNFYQWTDFALLQMACPDHVDFFIFDKKMPVILTRKIYSWFGITVMAGEHHEKAYDIITQKLLAGRFVCLQSAEAEKYKEWADKTVDAPLITSIMTVPFFIGLLDDNGHISPTSYRCVNVIIGKPFPLQVNRETLLLNLDELSFQWSRYCKDKDEVIFS